MAQEMEKADCISIHALCEEGDHEPSAQDLYRVHISIHALCEEGDYGILLSSYVNVIFLSTPSARRAT